MIFKDGLTPHYLCLIKSTYWKWLSFWVLHFLQGPLVLEPLTVLEPNPTPHPSKKRQKRGENGVEYSAVLHSPRWDQFHPNQHLRIQAPCTAGMMETESLQVCVLCPQFLLLTLHIPTPVAAGVLGPHGQATTACLELCANRPPPAPRLGQHLMVEVTIYDNLSSSNLVCDGNTTAGPPLFTHSPILLKSAKDVHSTFGTPIPFLLCWAGWVGPNILGELMDRNKPIWNCFHFKGKLRSSPQFFPGIAMSCFLFQTNFLLPPCGPKEIRSMTGSFGKCPGKWLWQKGNNKWVTRSLYARGFSSGPGRYWPYFQWSCAEGCSK